MWVSTSASPEDQDLCATYFHIVGQDDSLSHGPMHGVCIGWYVCERYSVSGRPMFSPIDGPRAYGDDDIAVFTLSKLTGAEMLMLFLCLIYDPL